VRRHAFLDSGAVGSLADCLPDHLLGDGLVGAQVVYGARKQIGLGAHPAIVFTQNWEQLFTEGNFTVNTAFALYDAQHHALAVYIADFETAKFGPA
jgi:hypothetical protein